MDRRDKLPGRNLKNFLHSFLKSFFFREKSCEDVVVDASGKLDIGEFEIFQLSYEAWFGEEGEIKFLEENFLLYLNAGTIPQWVRHYSRNIILEYKSGRLDKNSPRFHKFDRKPHSLLMEKPGLLNYILVAGFLAVIVIFIVCFSMSYIGIAGKFLK